MSGSRQLHIAVGFDGDGTKTECAVLDSEGITLATGVASPSNRQWAIPHRLGTRPDAPFSELAQAAAEALANAHLNPRQVESVCAGLAGTGRRSMIRNAIVFLTHEFPDALTHVTTDCEVALEAAVGAGAGVVVIAGARSSAFGRNDAGETAQAGGFGRSIGDDGSAYEIGRRAVAWMARARDQGTPAKLLSDIIFATLNCHTWEELAERIAQNPDAVFPLLFPAVVSAAGLDDNAARDILYAAAVDLAATGLTVVRRLGLEEIEFPLVKCGGVFGVSPVMEEMFDVLVASGAPRVAISRLEVPVAVGAARLAARLARDEGRVAVYGRNS
jgi:N-acetylglucosamine kinase-like BadF-type ATPase